MRKNLLGTFQAKTKKNILTSSSTMRKAFWKGKVSYVREVVDAYFKDKKITKEVYDALYRYEPKFKD